MVYQWRWSVTEFYCISLILLETQEEADMENQEMNRHVLWQVLGGSGEQVWTSHQWYLLKTGLERIEQGGTWSAAQLNVMAVRGFIPPYPQSHQPSALSDFATCPLPQVLVNRVFNVTVNSEVATRFKGPILISEHSHPEHCSPSAVYAYCAYCAYNYSIYICVYIRGSVSKEK